MRLTENQVLQSCAMDMTTKEESGCDECGVLESFDVINAKEQNEKNKSIAMELFFITDSNSTDEYGLTVYSYEECETLGMHVEA